MAMTNQGNKRDRFSGDEAVEEQNSVENGSAKRIRAEFGDANGNSKATDVSNLFSDSDRLFEGTSRLSMTKSYTSSIPYLDN
jgi:hypothetical protein